jgi:hypothetical protein
VRRHGKDVVRTRCDAANARAFVSGFDTNIGGTFGNPDCPDDTDFFTLISLRRVGCFRNLGLPHPGDAGAGGGILRAGDCVDAGFIAGSEVPCRSREVFAHVTRRVSAVGDCPSPTIEYAKLVATTRRIACLAGPGVIRPGDCLSQAFGISKVPCRSSGATDVVVTRVARARDCPRATRAADLDDPHLLWSPMHASSTRRPILCLRRR